MKRMPRMHQQMPSNPRLSRPTMVGEGLMPFDGQQQNGAVPPTYVVWDHTKCTVFPRAPRVFCASISMPGCGFGVEPSE